MIALHGTSKQNALSIIENGYKATKTNFTVSDKNCCYGILTDPSKIEVVDITQCFLQGYTACIANNEPLDSYVLLIDITDCEYEKDLNFHARFNSIVIKTHVRSDKIKGVLKLSAPLHDFYRYVWYTKMSQNPVNFRLSDEDYEIVKSIEFVKIVPGSVKRDIQVLRNDLNLNIPQCPINF